MPDAASIAGPSQDVQRAVAPLWRLLGERGVEVPAQVLAEECAPAPSMPALAACLRRRGVPARVVSVDEPDLGSLRTPTLVLLEDGAPAVLRRVGWRRFTLELAGGGRLRLPRARWASATRGQALDLGEALRSDLGPLAQVWSLLGAQRGYAVRLILSSAAVNVLALAPPVATRLVMDRALPDGAHSLLGLVAVSTVLVTLHLVWLGVLGSRASRFFGVELERALATLALQRALALPFAEQSRRGLGELSQSLGSARALARQLCGGLLVPLLNAVFVVPQLVMLAASFGSLAAAAVLASSVLLVVAALVGRTLAAIQAEELRRGARQGELLYELIAGASTIKSAGAERSAVGRWIGALVDERVLATRRARLSNTLQTLAEAVHYAMLTAVLVVGGARCLEGDLSVGALTASLQLAVGFMAAMGWMTHLALDLPALRTHYARVADLLRAPSERSARSDHEAESTPAAGSVVVELDDVWFRHGPDQPWAVRGESLRLVAGQRHELRGPSGCGKTTLLRLVAGLYQPERGAVTLCGMPADAARHLVAYLPQETYLFAGSLLENLRLLSGSAPHERIVAASIETGLDDAIRSWPMGLETIVPPGGGSLSGGQRQLVALTACVASRRPIVLLDESLTHLDPITRARLVRSDLFRGRAMLSVAHDPVVS